MRRLMVLLILAGAAGTCLAQTVPDNPVRKFRACTAMVGVGVVMAENIAEVDPYEQLAWPSDHRRYFDEAETCLAERVKSAVADADGSDDLKEAIKQFYSQAKTYIGVAKELTVGRSYSVVTKVAKDRFAPFEQRLVLEMELVGK